MKILHQSVFEQWPMEDGSVQAVVTSPPYWGLRKYKIPDVVIGGRQDCEHDFEPTPVPGGNGDGAGARRDKQAGMKRGVLLPGFCKLCGAWKGQYGLEPDFREYIAHTLLWCQEAWRVLRPDGVFWLNMGDCYQSGNRGGYHRDDKRAEMSPNQAGNVGSLEVGLQPNRLPQAGLRPKCKVDMPARVRLALVDEQGWILRNVITWWKRNGMPESVGDRFASRSEDVMMLVKEPKYFFDLDAVRVSASDESIARAGRNRFSVGVPEDAQAGHAENTPQGGVTNPLGVNPGDVWDIRPQPSSVEHYAMWPEALVARMLKCSTRAGDLVLDPFCGSGRTLQVAADMGRKAVGIDLGYEDIQRQVLGMRLVEGWS